MGLRKVFFVAARQRGRTFPSYLDDNFRFWSSTARGPQGQSTIDDRVSLPDIVQAREPKRKIGDFLAKFSLHRINHTTANESIGSAACRLCKEFSSRSA
jgi:hypothetical protein